MMTEKLLNAIDANDMQNVMTLLNDGLNPSDADQECGETPLLRAALGGRVDMLLALLKFGANPNVKSGQAQVTALHVACRYGQVTAVKALLQFGADATAVSPLGWTPLTNALKSGCSEAVQLLVCAGGGADLTCVNALGWTALQFAAKYRKRELVRWLALRDDVRRRHDDSSSQALALRSLIGCFRQRASLLVLCYRCVTSERVDCAPLLSAIAHEHCQHRYDALIDSIDISDEFIDIMGQSAGRPAR
jgi:ankyrin repeat protein